MAATLQVVKEALAAMPTSPPQGWVPVLLTEQEDATVTLLTDAVSPPLVPA